MELLRQNLQLQLASVRPVHIPDHLKNRIALAPPLEFADLSRRFQAQPAHIPLQRRVVGYAAEASVFRLHTFHETVGIAVESGHLPAKGELQIRGVRLQRFDVRLTAG